MKGGVDGWSGDGLGNTAAYFSILKGVGGRGVDGQGMESEGKRGKRGERVSKNRNFLKCGKDGAGLDKNNELWSITAKVVCIW
jgi:hypothetical protein